MLELLLKYVNYVNDCKKRGMLRDREGALVELNINVLKQASVRTIPDEITSDDGGNNCNGDKIGNTV